MNTALSFLIVLLTIVIYFVPVIVARIRHINGIGQVVVVNILLGWTVIGWIIALVMAFRRVE